MLKFDVVTNTTKGINIGKSGMFLHERSKKVYICKLCQIADMGMYTCLVEVEHDDETEWVMAGSVYHGIADIEDDKVVTSPVQRAIDVMLDLNPAYHNTYTAEEFLRPFKDVAELYSVYAKEKQWTLQVDLQGDVVRLDTISTLPVFFKRRDEAAVQRVSYWGYNGVNDITWQEFFDHYELVTWYDFRTHDYASIPCGIMREN